MSTTPANDAVSVLRDALTKIARWHGEFPVTESGASYATDFGANGERDYMRQVALAALGDSERAAIQPAGFVLVPVEPTPAMLNALFVLPDFQGSVIVKHSVDKLPSAYAAMLRAAPVAQAMPAAPSEAVSEQVHADLRLAWKLLDDAGHKAAADRVFAFGRALQGKPEAQAGEKGGAL